MDYRGALATVIVLALLAASSAADYPAQADAAPSQASGTDEGMSVQQCATYVGFDPDSFILVYQNAKGASLKARALTASRRTGVPVGFVDVGLLADRDIRLLQCFYGKYAPGDVEFVRSPRLLCPRTGAVEDVYLSRMGLRELRAFANGCRG